MALLALGSTQQAYAHDKAEGTLVEVKDGKLTLTAKGNGKKSTMNIGKEATVTLDGKPAKVVDLKAGFSVTLALGEEHVITKIEALSKPKDEKPKSDRP
jgi:hypothetical protein